MTVEREGVRLPVLPLLEVAAAWPAHAELLEALQRARAGPDPAATA